jgi:hypothetical protein
MIRILSKNRFASCITLSLDARVHYYELAAM